MVTLPAATPPVASSRMNRPISRVVHGSVSSGSDRTSPEKVALARALLNVPDRLCGATSLSEEEVAGWLACDGGRAVPPREVSDWLAHGVRTASERPAGLAIEDVRWLANCAVSHRAGWVRRLDAGWGGVVAVCPDLVALGVRKERSAREIVALFTALAPTVPGHTGSHCTHTATAAGRRVSGRKSFRCGWSVVGAVVANNAALLLHDVNWEDVATCMGVGMSAEDAASFLRDGGDMATVRVMAGLLA